MLGRNRIKSTFGAPVLYDRWLIVAVLGLIVLGLMMVASSSVMISTKFYHQPFHFLLRQAIYLFVGFVLAVVVMRIDSSLWERYSVPLLFVCLIMLVLVLVPGIGRVVNGSRRWLSLGPIGVQVSELAKITMIIYVSGYLVRQEEQVKQNIMGFLKPMVIMMVMVPVVAFGKRGINCAKPTARSKV